MAKLKPLPKAIALAAILGVAGYFVNDYMDKRPKEPAAVSAPAPEIKKSEHAKVEPAYVPPPVVTKAEPAPEPTPEPAASSSNAGMNALLKGRK